MGASTRTPPRAHRGGGGAQGGEDLDANPAAARRGGCCLSRTPSAAIPSLPNRRAASSPSLPRPSRVPIRQHTPSSRRGREGVPVCALLGRGEVGAPLVRPPMAPHANPTWIPTPMPYIKGRVFYVRRLRLRLRHSRSRSDAPLPRPAASSLRHHVRPVAEGTAFSATLVVDQCCLRVSCPPVWPLELYIPQSANHPSNRNFARKFPVSFRVPRSDPSRGCRAREVEVRASDLYPT